MSNDTTHIPTPRTDVAAQPYAVWVADNTRPDRGLVDAFFARTLERELAQAKAENAALRKDRERLSAELSGLKLFKGRYDEDFKMLKGSASELAVIDELKRKAAMEGGER